MKTGRSLTIKLGLRAAIVHRRFDAFLQLSKDIVNVKVADLA